MHVRDLIKHAAKGGQRTQLPREALADLKAVLKANDTQPNRFKRVSADQFLEHLAEQYAVHMCHDTLRRFVRRELGRAWGG